MSQSGKRAAVSAEELKRRQEQSKRDKALAAAKRPRNRPGRRRARPFRQPQPQRPPPAVMRTARKQLTPVSTQDARAARIVKTLMLPGNMPPIRMPTASPQMTALHRFRTLGSMTVDSAIGGIDALMLFRDPVYPIWARTPVPSDLKIAHYVTVDIPHPANSMTAGNAGFFPIPLRNTETRFSIRQSATMAFGSFDPSGFFGPSGKLPVGVSPGIDRLWFYVPAGCWVSATITTDGKPDGGAWNATILYSPDGTTLDAQTIECTGHSADSTSLSVAHKLKYSGWVSWDKLTATRDPTDIAAPGFALYAKQVMFGWVSGGSLLNPDVWSGPATAMVYPWFPAAAPEFTVASSLYERCRVSASALLLSNAKSESHAEGTINAYNVRCNGRDIYTQTLEKNAGAHLAPNLSWSGKAAKGLYCFTTPQMNDGEMLDVSNQRYPGTPITTATPFFSLDTHQWCYIITFGVSNAVEASQEFMVTFDTHLESVTDSQLWTADVSPYSFDQARAVASALMGIKPFTENPIHIPTLLRAALAILANVARAGAPFFNPLAHKAVDYLIPLQ